MSRPPLSISRTAFQAVRALSTDLVNRVQFAVRAGLAWGMSRRIQLYQVLGYETRLTIQHYRALYERDGLAQRIVDLPPSETWIAGFEVVEDEDPEKETDFEKAAWELSERLNLKGVFLAADQLAGLGHYSGVLIGAGYPGQSIDLSKPLPVNVGGPDNVIYLTPFAEDNCRVTKLDTDPASPHYGQPLTYEVVLGLPTGGVQFDTIYGLSQNSLGEVVPNVHWTRVLHIAEKAHENKIYGVPRLRAVYDYLEALFKVVHGGAEGAWRRMDPGIYIDIDPELDIRPDPSSDGTAISDEDAQAAAIRQVEQKAQDYYQGMNRFIVGRGMQVTPLNANVKDYGANSDTLLKLIAAATGIPLRILTGSEMGKLASDQDRENANDRASERRMSFAEGVVRQFIDRLIEYKALPKPKLNNGKYQIQWGEAQKELTETEKATVTSAIALANSNQANAGDTIILTSSEIREKVWGLDPLTKDQLPEPEPPPQVVVAPGTPPGTPGGQPNAQSDSGKVIVNRAQESFKLSSTQIQLPEPIYSKIISLGLSIPDESLAVDGREDNPHVTVKYGLHTDRPELVKALVAGYGAVSLVFGKTAIFEGVDHDVLYTEIESASLVALNQLISDSLQVTNTQPIYVPHATIAYLKPGLGKQYVGMIDLKAVGVSVSRLQFSSSSGEVTTIELGVTS